MLPASALYECMCKYLSAQNIVTPQLFIDLLMLLLNLFLNLVLGMYMYVCMYACMYVCMHACMYGCMYISTHGIDVLPLSMTIEKNLLFTNETIGAMRFIFFSIMSIYLCLHVFVCTRIYIYIVCHIVALCMLYIYIYVCMYVC